MSEPLTLLDLWLSRLNGESVVDLVEHGSAVVPELLRVYTPDDFELRLLDGSWLRAQHGQVFVELTAELAPLNGVAVSSGVIQRRIDTSGRHAEHVKLELPEEACGEGRGRSLLRASADLYANLGLERISLLAVDKGPLRLGRRRIQLRRRTSASGRTR